MIQKTPMKIRQRALSFRARSNPGHMFDDLFAEEIRAAKIVGVCVVAGLGVVALLYVQRKK